MHKSVGVLDNPLEGRGCRMGAIDVRAEYASTVYKFFSKCDQNLWKLNFCIHLHNPSPTPF